MQFGSVTVSTIPVKPQPGLNDVIRQPVALNIGLWWERGCQMGKASLLIPLGEQPVQGKELCTSWAIRSLKRPFTGTTSKRMVNGGRYVSR